MKFVVVSLIILVNQAYHHFHHHIFLRRVTFCDHQGECNQCINSFVVSDDKELFFRYAFNSYLAMVIPVEDIEGISIIRNHLNQAGCFPRCELFVVNDICEQCNSFFQAFQLIQLQFFLRCKTFDQVVLQDPVSPNPELCSLR